MNFIAWFFIVYGTIGLLTLRPVAGHFAWNFCRYSSWCKSNSRPDGEQWFGGLLLALLCAMIWPIGGLWLLMSPGHLGRAVGAEKAAQIEELQRKLIAAEKELGIND